MRTLATLSLAVFAGIGLAQQAADVPSVDDVLAKAIKANGGKEAMEKITTLVSKGTIEVVTFGANGDIEITRKAPDKQLTRSTFEGFGEVVQCYDGKAGWAVMPDSGMRDVTGAELDAMRWGAQMNSLLHLKEQFPGMKVEKGKVGEKDAYVLGNEKTKLFFDATTSLMTRMELDGAQGKTVVSLDDFKPVEGVQMPHTMRQETPEMSLIIRFAQMQANVPVEDSKFAKPAAK